MKGRWNRVHRNVMELIPDATASRVI